MKLPAYVLAMLSCFLALPVLSGCGLTEAERSDIVAKSAETAGELAYQKTLAEVAKRLDELTAKQLETMKAAGATAEQLAEAKKKLDEQSKVLAEQLAEAARAAAKAATSAITDKAIPAGEDTKSTKTGHAIAEIAGLVLLLAQGALRKGLI